MTQAQALALLEKFASQNYQPERGLMSSIPEGGEPDTNLNYAAMLSNGNISLGVPRDDINYRPSDYPQFAPRPEIQRALSSFSPFSPDPNLMVDDKRRDAMSAPNRLDSLPHPSKAYAPGFMPLDPKDRTSPTGLPASNRLSPTSSRPSSASRYGFADSSDPLVRNPGRVEAPISRPPSGQTVSPQDTGRFQDMDPTRDLSNTLSHLDLSANSAVHAGQFHLTNA